MSPSAYPVRMPATVFMLHGAMIMPSVGYEPEEMAAAWSPGPYTTSASLATSRAL